MKDYIKDLRKKIGHDPVILPGATVLVFNTRHELLILLRTDIDCWGVPGGSMEPGETLEDTAKRETFEETGLKVENLVLFDVFSGPEMHTIYPNGDECYFVSAVYVTHDAGGEINLGFDEHSQWGFFPLDKLPEKISPTILPILEKYKKHVTLVP